MLYALEDPGPETMRVPVVRVFDGDGFLTRLSNPQRTLEFEVAVRFGFIDAPELEQPGGQEAKQFLTSLIGGQLLDLILLMKMDTGRMIDRHSRIVAVPYLKQKRLDEGRGPTPILKRIVAGFTGDSHVWRNIELEMVLNGWAWVLDRYGPEERYFEALEDAQRHCRGIWALSNNIHPWEFKRQRYSEKRAQGHGSPRHQNLFSEQGLSRCREEGCKGHLVQRSGRFGSFYGCSEFPHCRYSRTLL